MPDLLIRNLSPHLRNALKERAKRHRHSLSAEVKSILSRALGSGVTGGKGIGSRMVALFQEAGPIDIEIDRSDLGREPPDFT